MTSRGPFRPKTSYDSMILWYVVHAHMHESECFTEIWKSCPFMQREILQLLLKEKPAKMGRVRTQCCCNISELTLSCCKYFYCFWNALCLLVLYVQICICHRFLLKVLSVNQYLPRLLCSLPSCLMLLLLCALQALPPAFQDFIQLFTGPYLLLTFPIGSMWWVFFLWRLF